MKYRYSSFSHVLIAATILAFSVGCPQSSKKPDSDPKKTSTETAKKTKAGVVGFVEGNKGKIQVLLLGMPGCSGTETATPEMVAYAKEKPEGVVLARIDVPVPGKTLTKETELDPELKYVIDSKRKVATKLEFFFYPTLYLLDKDGAVRYSGKADLSKVRKMVKEIRAEDPALPKKMYTALLPKFGSTIENFTATTLQGDQVTLKDLSNEQLTFILFANTTCPFSKKAVESLPELLKPFKGKKLSTVILNYGQNKDDIATFYEEKAANRLVVVDPTSTTSEGVFKVSVTPFFFILNKDQKVVVRKPYTLDQAKSDLGKILGVKVSCGPSCGVG